MCASGKFQIGDHVTWNRESTIMSPSRYTRLVAHYGFGPFQVADVREEVPSFDYGRKGTQKNDSPSIGPIENMKPKTSGAPVQRIAISIYGHILTLTPSTRACWFHERLLKKVYSPSSVGMSSP